MTSRGLHHVVIGCGTAGLSALEAIRHARPDDPITMISAERDPPYSPTVLPHLLAGRIEESRVALRPVSFFDRVHCRLLLGMEATAIDSDRRVVLFPDGSRIEFDTLLLAAGSEPVTPNIENPHAVPVLTFTRLAHLRVLKALLAEGCRVAVLGAGLIGMELAEALVHVSKGIRVTVVEQENQVLPRSFSREMAGEILALFETQGIEFHLGRRAVAIEKSARAAVVTLSDGSTHTADLVVACVGVRPRINFLAGSGLATRHGVLVDRRMATNLPNVFAAGDLAEGPSVDGKAGCHPVLPTAARQGYIAGINMSGGSVEHEGWLPANSFNFFRHSTVSVGVTSAGLGQQLVEHVEGGRRSQLVLEGDRLVGGSFFDASADPGALSWLIRERVPVRQYADLLAKRPLEAGRWLASRAQRGAA